MAIWRDSSMVKSTCCSHGPELRTQHSCDLNSNVGRDGGGQLEIVGFQTEKMGVPKFRERHLLKG